LTLHVTGEIRGRLGLLLDADRPITWRLAGGAAAPSSSLTILLGPAGSAVLDAQGAPLPSRALAPAATPEARMQRAKEAFQHLTTFTTIKSANKIVISLPQGITISLVHFETINGTVQYPVTTYLTYGTGTLSVVPVPVTFVFILYITFFLLLKDVNLVYCIVSFYRRKKNFNLSDHLKVKISPAGKEKTHKRLLADIYPYHSAVSCDHLYRI
jgi:hypothetical protein